MADKNMGGGDADLSVYLSANVEEFERNINSATNTFARASQKITQTADHTANEVAKSQKKTQMILTNASFQVQDMVVQLSGGVDAFRVMGMQLPQLIGSFSMLGGSIALIGAGLGTLLAFLPIVKDQFEKFFTSQGKLKGILTDANNDLEKIRNSVKEPMDLFVKLVEKPATSPIMKRFEEALVTGRELELKAAVQLTLERQQDIVKDLQKEVDALGKSIQAISLNENDAVMMALAAQGEYIDNLATIAEMEKATAQQKNAQARLEEAQRMLRISQLERDYVNGTNRVNAEKELTAEYRKQNAERAQLKAINERSQLTYDPAKEAREVNEFLKGVSKSFDDSIRSRVNSLRTLSNEELKLADELYSIEVKRAEAEKKITEEARKREIAARENSNIAQINVKKEIELINEKAEAERQAAIAASSVDGIAQKKVDQLLNQSFRDRKQLEADLAATKAKYLEMDANDPNRDLLLKKIEEYQKKLAETGDIYQRMAYDFETKFVDQFINGMLKGTMSFKDFVRNFLADWATMLLKKKMMEQTMGAATGIGGVLSSVGTSIFGSMFGGSSTSSVADTSSSFQYDTNGEMIASNYTLPTAPTAAEIVKPVSFTDQAANFASTLFGTTKQEVSVEPTSSLFSSQTIKDLSSSVTDGFKGLFDSGTTGATDTRSLTESITGDSITTSSLKSSQPVTGEVVVNIANNASGSTATAQQVTASDGSKQLNITISDVNDAVASGALDNTLRTSFGLVRRGT